MFRSLIFLVAMGATPLAADSDVESLLREADAAISPEPVKKNPSPPAKPKTQPKKEPVVSPTPQPAPTAKPEERSLPENGGLHFSDDRDLVRLLDMDMEVNAQGSQTASLFKWSLGWAFHKTSDYKLMKDDDHFIAKKGQMFHGLGVSIYPFRFWQGGAWEAEPFMGVQFFTPKVRLDRKGLVNVETEYSHRIIAADLGIAVSYFLFDKTSLLLRTGISGTSIMQDGRESNDTIFDMQGGVAFGLEVNRQIFDLWSLVFGGTFREQGMQSSSRLLQGVTYTIGLEYARHQPTFSQTSRGM